MQTFKIHQAKAQLSKLVERARAGEEIVLVQAGEPVARIAPYLPAQALRKPGALKGKFQLGKDFFAPLPDEVLAAFEGTATKMRKSR